MENLYKNKIHLEPPKGLLNDPNGLSFFQGKYYVFHQWNRFECNHSYKEWGFFTSKDLLHWSHGGSAILPDRPEDFKGVYSGSAIVDKSQLRLFYTGNSRINDARKSFQCQATSLNGQSFLKQSSMETPSEFTEHHRDPKVFFFDEKWQMIVGAQTKDGKGAISSFSSIDLENWEYQGIFFQDDSLEQMCECPDLLNFGEKQVLLVCPQKRDLETDQDISSYSGYYIGKVIKNRFIPETSLQKLDLGFDFYAPQTFRDPKGRYLMWAWMSRMTDEEEKACPTLKDNYLHCLTLPREISLKNEKLYQKPIEELTQSCEIIQRSCSKSLSFNQTSETLLLAIDFKDSPNSFQLQISDQVNLSYQNKQLYLQRRSWVNQENFEKRLTIQYLESLEVFLDQSAIEIFINDGEETMSLRYFPKESQKNHQFACSTPFTATLSNINLGDNHG